jgi:hypothetical protein
MTDTQLTTWCTLISLALAYVLPVTLWRQRITKCGVEFFSVPALLIGSWWLSGELDFFRLGGSAGITFYGALAAAVLSNIAILVFMHMRRSRPSDKHFAIPVFLASLVLGVALHTLLPAIPE